MSFFEPKLPNLELLVYKTRLSLSQDKGFMDRLEKKKSGNMHVAPDYDVITFPQIWGSTCTGFDQTPGGDPVFSGCAMTKEYTTVIHENVTDTYVVFFGETPCYVVDNPSEDFLKDLKERNLASLSEAHKRY